MSTDSIDKLPDMTGLTEEEKNQLVAVMQRAKDFEIKEENHLMRQPLEGQLFKYTNVMKGWQYRWFALDPETGRLEYFEKEEHKKHRARGQLHLAGAVISPSDEDSQTFQVNAANGEVYRLRAFDAKERQHWVSRLRATAEHHTDSIALSHPPLKNGSKGTATVASQPSSANGSQDNLATSSSASSRSKHQSLPNHAKCCSPSRLHKGTPHHRSSPSMALLKRSPQKTSPGPPLASQEEQESFKNTNCMMKTAQGQQSTMDHRIEDLSSSGGLINSLDSDMLLMKATSKATLACLEQCLQILHQKDSGEQSAHGSRECLDPKQYETPLSQGTSGAVSPAESFVSVASGPVCDTTKCQDAGPIDHNDDVEDDHEYTDTVLGAVEEHKNIILHLLSQLKLGMDLTKVVLPTFILEKRSLLEMFADCMAHPDKFLQIPSLPTPEERMLGVVEWYLTSFHKGRTGTIAKKPYNPIIGETFHCSWLVPDDVGKATECDEQTVTNGVVNDEEQNTPLYYCAEQVSHHPPISAFYFECPEKQMCMNASIWTKSKFLGMSIGVVMVGKLKMQLLEHDEEYEFTMPSAYARSILTVPWVELGDRVVVSCAKTGYSAAVTFHTRPFFGGKLHKVTSEVKDPAGNVISKTTGEWNATLEFNYEKTGETKVIDTTQLESIRKRVRPIDMQSDFESRKLWNNVTEALQRNDVDGATQHKHFLEERQRQGEKYRRETTTQFPTRYFHKEGDVWVYNNVLQRGQKVATA